MEVSSSERVIVLVDMDCFYVQVEQKLCPEYQNKPCAVVQYKAWKGGGIIAVNYEARAKGVTRSLRGDDALKVCPDIHLFRVPEIRGKADLTRYREAGAAVLDVLCEYSDCVERASIDEAYLDMTSVISSKIQNSPRVTLEQLQNTFVVGWEGEDSESRKEELEKWLQMIYEEEHLYHDRMLAVTAVIVEEMRTAVYEKTGYRCSAGIAHNKMLSKLSCGLHKPNKQTVLPQASIQLLFKTIPIKKVRNLGGKLGEAIVKKFNVEKMGDLFDISRSQLVNHFGEKTGNWLYNLVRGIDSEAVTSRQLPKSIGCGKNFPGKQSLSTKKDVIHWLKQLATELEERLLKDQNDNRRFARLLTVSVRTNENGMFSMVSRSVPIHVYNSERLAHDALVAVSKLNSASSDMLWKPSIWTLSMAASKFEDRLDTSHCNIESYFSKGNTSINTSAASTSSVCNDIDQSLDSKNKFLKSAKPDIVSYFKKNQDAKVKSLKEIETEKDISEDNKELDSFLSVCNDMNNIDSYADESCDSNTGKASTVIGNTGSVFCDKQNESVRILEDKEESACNDVDFVDINDKSCNSKTESEIVLPDKQDKTSGFFTRKLKEQCKSYFNVGSELSCDSSNKKFSDTETGEASHASDIKTITSNNENEPLGFFAKSLKEQSNLNFDIGFEINSDSSDNKLNNSGTSEASRACDTKSVASNNKNESLGFFAKTVKEQSNLNFNVGFEINSDSSDSKLNGSEITVASNNKNEPLGVFAKNVKEQSNLNVNVRFDINSDSKLNDSETSEAARACDTKTVASNNKNEPLGFFAKKLKERSEGNFSVESETSCDSLKSEPVKNNQAEHLKNCNSGASSSISMHQQSSCCASNGDSEFINLDPELTKLCEQCNKRFPIWEETEHLDYHLALNLSKEFSNNHRTVLHSTGNNSSSGTGKNASQKSKSGRKRGSATKSTSQSKKPLVKTKTLDSFFKS